ncbi:MAG: MFS transporter [Granulosicoccus sp.]|nr:MFS transporter [Granulosicoccus sp.]
MKTRSISLLVVAEVAAMSLWFVSSATLADQQTEVSIAAFRAALMVSAVPAGFVAGALYVALSGIADRWDPRKVFAFAAVVAALANLLVLAVTPGSTVSIMLRAIIGFCLAGVYPVGMKIAVGWGQKDRGWLVGLLVGGLTLGSAAPHLLAWLGGTHWRLTTGLASCLALLSAALVLQTQLGPLHATQKKMDPRVIGRAWTDKRLRRAFFGYFGHMWELYALWAWIAPAAAASYRFQVSDAVALDWSKLTAFAAIGAGALLCPFAGKLADRIGKAELTIVSMAISGSSAVAAAIVFGGPVWLVAAVFIIWGLSVIPDSAQFSALVADLSPQEISGSLLSLQTALGFALTIITVQMTPLVASAVGWHWLFCILALGPLIGIWSMTGITRNRLK